MLLTDRRHYFFNTHKFHSFPLPNPLVSQRTLAFVSRLLYLAITLIIVYRWTHPPHPVPRAIRLLRDACTTKVIQSHGTAIRVEMINDFLSWVRRPKCSLFITLPSATFIPSTPTLFVRATFLHSHAIAATYSGLQNNRSAPKQAIVLYFKNHSQPDKNLVHYITCN